MGFKRTTVYLDADVLSLAYLYGLENISDFFRDALTFFVSESGDELTKSQVRDILKQFALKKRTELQSQMRITEQTEEERAKITEIQNRRFLIISEAVKMEAERIGSGRFKKYLADENGDYTKIQDDILKSVSQKAGFGVQLFDVIRAFKEIQV